MVTCRVGGPVVGLRVHPEEHAVAPRIVGKHYWPGSCRSWGGPILSDRKL